jgi:hypothetical protein
VRWFLQEKSPDRCVIGKTIEKAMHYTAEERQIALRMVRNNRKGRASMAGLIARFVSTIQILSFARKNFVWIRRENVA